MKQLITLSALLLYFSGFSQIQTDMGGSFSFEYISTNADGTLKYDVFFSYSNDTSWSGSGSTGFGFYKKSSQSTPYSNLSMTSVSGASQISTVCGLNLHNSTVYKQTIDLDPNSQYEFAHSWCCRSSLVVNLDSAQIRRQYIRSILITGRPGVRNHNSSPDLRQTFYAAPMSELVPLYLCSSDPDGDSLSFDVVSPLQGTANTSSFSMSSIPYDTTLSFSANHPLGSNSVILIDTIRRILQVSGPAPIVSVLNIRIKEWAKDTNNVYKLMGVHFKEMAIDFGDMSAPSMIQSDTVITSFASDTIIIDLDGEVYLLSNALDSGNVVLTDPNSDTVNIYELDYAGDFDKLFLRSDSLMSPGIWTIYFNKINNSAIKGSCGDPLVDTVRFYLAPPEIELIGDSGSVYAGTIKEYYALNTEYYDSLSWLVFNGNLTFLGNDTVEVEWGINNNGLGEIKIDAIHLLQSNFIATLSRDSIAVNINGLLVPNNYVETSIQPNPASDYITVSGIRYGERFRIIDIFGSVIIDRLYIEEKIQLESMSSGIYLFQVQFGSEWSSQRFIVNK